MTVRTLGDLVLYAGGLAAALTAIGVLLRWLVVKPLRDWIAEQAQPARTAASELRPNGGGSARDVVEKTSRQVSDIATELGDIAVQVKRNAELANQALTIAQETSHRLDRHLLDHHTEI